MSHFESYSGNFYFKMKKLIPSILYLYLFLPGGIARNSEREFLVPKSKTDKPSFILIMADDLGYGDIECYGNTYIKTPNLDRMANEGVRFMDFHSNGAVSSPTRAALLTGKYQQRAGITGVITAKNHRDVGLPLSETTIAEVLRNEGYKTGIFGKWHLGYSKTYNPINHGFNEFIGYVSGNVDYHSHVDQEGYYDWWREKELINQRGYTTDLITENAISFIQRNKDYPFFLFVAHEAPHSPYQNRESKADRCPGGVPGVDFPVSGSGKDISSLYKNMIEILDENVGKIMDILKELDLDKKTVVIFCSDNGANKNGSNGCLRGFKGSLWEGGHRVPAIIRWPEYIEPGWTSKETVLTMDLFPTIIELAGVKSYNNVDGTSIVRHLLDSTPLPVRTLFWQHEGQYAVRKGKWKLIVSDNESPELYDLEKDIKEMFNVSEKYPDKVKELLDELKKWKRNVFNGVEKIS